MTWTNPQSVTTLTGITATWGQNVAADLTLFGTASTAYTPTLAGFTAGNGTATGQYWQFGKLVVGRCRFTFGSTSIAASARPTLTLPVAMVNPNTNVQVSGFFFNSSNWYMAHVFAASTTTLTWGIVGSSGLNTAPTTTTPFTWVTGSLLEADFTYESV